MFSAAPLQGLHGRLPDLADSLVNTAVWRAGELGSASLPTVATGYEALDAVLPGGGWPQGALVEVMQPQAGMAEWGLVAPALAAVQVASPGQMTVLVGAPSLPFGPALAAWRLQMPRLLRVDAPRGQAPALLWATREALQCGDVGAVLAWLPDARSAHLRRLQIAAHAHNKLLFVFRPLRAQAESSPAPLRLLLEGVAAPAEEAGNLRVHVLKRRGPPLAEPLVLDTRHERLAAFLAASGARVRRLREALAHGPLPVPVPSSREEAIGADKAARGQDLSHLLSGVPGLFTNPYPAGHPLHALLDRALHLDHH